MPAFSAAWEITKSTRNVEDYYASAARAWAFDSCAARAAPLQFGGATINLAGVDYQRMHQPYLAGAGADVSPAHSTCCCRTIPTCSR